MDFFRYFCNPFLQLATKNRPMAYRKIEEYDETTTREIAGHIRAILDLLGEDPSREGLQKTPERVAKAMQFLTQGYFQDGETIVKSALFQEPYNHMVIVKDIELFSLCEHHMLPFIGKAHVAYYFANKGSSSQTYGFPVVMYGCESLL